MHCIECQIQLPEYTEGTLTGHERETVASHLKGCATCTAALAGENKALAELHTVLEAGLQHRHLSLASRRRMAQAARAATHLKTLPALRLLLWNRPLAAAAALIIVGGLCVFRFSADPQTAAPEARTATMANDKSHDITNALYRLIEAACMSNSQERLTTAINSVCQASAVIIE